MLFSRLVAEVTSLAAIGVSKIHFPLLNDSLFSMKIWGGLSLACDLVITVILSYHVGIYFIIFLAPGRVQA